LLESSPVVRAFALLLAVAALVLVGTAAAHGPRVVAIGQKQNGENTEVHVGDTLVVSLPASPKSGYAWKLAAVNRRLLHPAGTGYVAATAPPLAQASSGIAVLIFKAVARGTTTLSINYVNGKTINKKFSVVIRVLPLAP
jgi:predicted secreted protein